MPQPCSLGLVSEAGGAAAAYSHSPEPTLEVPLLQPCSPGPALLPCNPELALEARGTTWLEQWRLHGELWTAWLQCLRSLLRSLSPSAALSHCSLICFKEEGVLSNGCAGEEGRG